MNDVRRAVAVIVVALFAEFSFLVNGNVASDFYLAVIAAVKAGSATGFFPGDFGRLLGLFLRL